MRAERAWTAPMKPAPTIAAPSVVATPSVAACDPPASMARHPTKLLQLVNAKVPVG
jgi:hypothetical protein